MEQEEPTDEQEMADAVSRLQEGDQVHHMTW